MATYWGMDTYDYPGDSKMQTIWTNSPLYFTGFYLTPAPNQKNDLGWMTKRQILADQGWGVVPIYLGQQVGDTTKLTASQGVTDANDAIALAKKAGFPNYTVIYLDVEEGGTLTTNYINYIKAWADQVFSNRTGTTFFPGVYCSYKDTAAQINKNVNAGNFRIWVYNISTKWNCSNSGNSGTTAPDASDSGFSANNLMMWQLAHNCSKTYGGVTLNMDINTSPVKNPAQITNL